MDEEDKPVCGPICELCEKPRRWLIPLLVKREKFGRYEMVKIYLCLHHFFIEVENDDEEPPEENKSVPEDDDEEGWKKFEEENPDDGEDEDEGWSSTTIDRVGQSFG